MRRRKARFCEAQIKRLFPRAVEPEREQDPEHQHPCSSVQFPVTTYWYSPSPVGTVSLAVSRMPSHHLCPLLPRAVWLSGIKTPNCDLQAEAAVTVTLRINWPLLPAVPYLEWPWDLWNTCFSQKHKKMYFHPYSIPPYSLSRALKEQSTVPGQTKASLQPRPPPPSLPCSKKLYLKDTSLTFSITPFFP